MSVHQPVEASAPGIRDCLSARRTHSSQSTSGPFVSGWKLQDQGGILQFFTWQSIASFAPATWSSYD